MRHKLSETIFYFIIRHPNQASFSFSPFFCSCVSSSRALYSSFFVQKFRFIFIALAKDFLVDFRFIYFQCLALAAFRWLRSAVPLCVFVFAFATYAVCHTTTKAPFSMEHFWLGRLSENFTKSFIEIDKIPYLCKFKENCLLFEP